MSGKESDETVGRLHRELKEATDRRVLVVERIKQIAAALRRLADAIDRTPDFEAVSQDSILQEYLDLSKIGTLVIEEKELSEKIMDYEDRLAALGF